MHLEVETEEILEKEEVMMESLLNQDQDLELVHQEVETEETQEKEEVMME